jgi:hypothetical protein
MSVSPDRNIWIPSRVPQSLPCPDCGRISTFVSFVEPDHYQYECSGCRKTKLLTLAQINATESHRFHKLPAAVVPPIISSGMSAPKP